MKSKLIPPLPANPSATDFLAYHIAHSGRTHREIAQLCGFARPNIVSMIKTGDVRLPLDRLGAMAQVLEVDTLDLFCLWMATYYANTWKDLRPLVCRVKTKGSGLKA